MIAGYVFWFINLKLGNDKSELEERLIEPFMAGAFCILFSLLLLSLLSDNHFNKWLKYIASWYIPVSTLFISQINIHSSFILSIDRVTASVYWMGGLFILTCAFVGYHLYIAKK
jgi:hypothetical protein